MTRTARRSSRVGLLVAAGALVASSAVLVVGLRLRANTAPVAATTAAALAATTTVPSPPAATTAPRLELPPVVLASSGAPQPASLDGPDAGPAPAAAARAWTTRPRPIHRTPAPAAPAARRASTEPQIVTEPRY